MNNSIKKIRASLVTLWSKETDFSKLEDIYHNGHDNMHPYEMERVLDNSPTGSRAVKLMSKYIRGLGVQEGAYEAPMMEVINKTLIESSKDLTKQGGVFFHVSYKVVLEGEEAKIVPSKPTVLNYLNGRISKEDDEGNKGKIYFEDYTLKKRKSKKDRKWYYPFNSNERVILEQIKNDHKIKNEGRRNVPDFSLKEAIKNYRGQVYYLNTSPEYVYAKSPFESVYNDCDTEYRISLYNNSMSRSGFLGKTYVAASGLSDDEHEQLKKDVKGWIGAENSDEVLVFSLEEEAKFSEVLQIGQIKSQFEDSQFEKTKEDVRTNILGAANNAPEDLALKSSSLFGKSAEAYIEMKKFYNEQTQEERDVLESAFKKIGFPITIKTMIDES